MEVKREVAEEMEVAALLKAAKHHKGDLVQRANAEILDGRLDQFGGSAHHKSAACSAIADIFNKICSLSPASTQVVCTMLQKSDTLQVKVRALLAELEQRKGYEVQLRVTVQVCQ